MRTGVALVVVLACIIEVAAQQKSTTVPTVSGTLARLKSPTWTEREKAFRDAVELLQLANNPQDADRLRLGVIQLLQHENSGGLKEPDNVKPEDYGEGYGEDKSEYYAGLIGFIGHMGDERAIPALLGAAGSGGIATRAVARFGKRALDPTLGQVAGQDSHLAAGALFVIRDMLKFRLVSDPESCLRIKNALRSALRSPDGSIRSSAMAPIEYLEDREEFVPMLQELAEHDPDKIPNQPKEDGTIGDHYFVRQSALRLLRKIKNHEDPVVDRGLDPSEYQPLNK